MKAWRALALTAAISASDELVHVALLLLPALGATLAAVGLALPLLARATVRARLGAIAVTGALVALGNLFVLSRLMFVSSHDSQVLTIVIVYSLGAGIGAAVAMARGSEAAVARLASTARSIGSGDLSARVGTLDAGAELDDLARALDEMAARLQETTVRERAAEGMRRDLITAVSHDLRTPLASLRAMVEAIDEGVVEDLPSLKRYLREMRASIDALVELVNDLFEFVQIDTDTIRSSSERARLEDIVGSALAACAMQAHQAGVDVNLRLDGVVGEGCSPRLMRVVQNLLQNAIRHTPPDGTVTIEARRSGEALELVVADTGEGIPSQHLDRIFEPFFKGDEARSSSGSGLGLALAKRIVEAMGGRIEVESEPARGARFAVVVPVPPKV
jgi:signal transduction histidine kinase